MLYHPLMQILYICDGVHDSTGFHDVRILRIQRSRDNAGLVFPSLEMWVGKTEEDLGELLLLEKVWKELHRVDTKAGNVLVAAIIKILIS